MTMLDAPVDVEVGSPRWWLHRLVGMLRIDQGRMVLMDRYYRGDHPLPYIPRELQSEFARMLARSRSNFMRVVVDATAERLKVQGFRQSGAEDADPASWDRWLASGLDALIPVAFETALVKSRMYLSTWRVGDDAPIYLEDPLQCVVEHEPGNRRKRAAALKIWRDDWTGLIRADVHLPDALHQFITTEPEMAPSMGWDSLPSDPMSTVEDLGWTPLLATPKNELVDLDTWQRQWQEMDTIVNPVGEVPIVPMVNRPSLTLDPDGESELDDVYLTQDRINETLFNRSLAAWTTAYRQKWATGIDIPVDEQGQPVEPYKAAVDHLWVSEDSAAKFGSFDATDLKPYIESIEQDVQHLAVQTRTPRHYFLQSGQSPSGDAIKSAEAGLVAKVLRKQVDFGGALVEIDRVARLFAGQDTPRIEVVWGDPEFRTLGELTDAVIKQHGAQLLPRQVALETLGRSPTEIQRIEALFAQEQLIADAQAQVEAPANPEPPISA